MLKNARDVCNGAGSCSLEDAAASEESDLGSGAGGGGNEPLGIDLFECDPPAIVDSGAEGHAAPVTHEGASEAGREP